jgi:N-acetylneuraminic acid mutarotase
MMNSLGSTTLLVFVLLLSISLALTVSFVFAMHKETFWTTGAEMQTNRSSLSGVALNGKIFVIGGGDVLNSKFPLIGNLGMTDTVEVYDPELNKWHNAPNIPQPLDHVASASYNGKIYAIGGFDKDRKATNTLYIYDPVADKWEKGKNMPTKRAASTAQFIGGILYVVGGMNGQEGSDSENPLRTNEAYNPETNKWFKKSPMPTARHHLGSAVIGGKLFAIGGRIATLNTTSNIIMNVNANEMYDPVHDTWTKLQPMALKNSGLGIAAVNESIYVFGGQSPLGTSYRNTAEYNPKFDNWTAGSSLPTGRLGLQAVNLDDKIYVIGGKIGAHTNSSGLNEIFNIKP